MRLLALALAATLAACVPVQNQPGPVSPAAPATTQPAPDGAALYRQSCAGCHQDTGAGIEGVFPPLARHVPAILKAEGGRGYLARVLLFGLQGPIRAQGKNYNGRMPAFSALEDAQIAALLNHLSRSWGNAELLPGFRSYTLDEVAALRADRLTMTRMLELRGSLSPQP
ncbi:MAG: cytochrome c [Meiothermus sp.]|nr:cytochrome c [Meiothermus sp.]